MKHPSTKVATEYLMTLHAPLAAPQSAGGGLLIFNALPGGWVRGPRIRGEIVPPTGDWLRHLPNGTSKLDVRMSIRADDGSFIYVAYGGRIVMSDAAQATYASGEALGPDDVYFVTAPSFETESEKYRWLNDIVAIGKIASAKRGENAHVTYDIFAVI
jgi:hypothetical protein